MKRPLYLIVVAAVTAAYICPTAITGNNSSSGEKVSMSPDTEIEIRRLSTEKARRRKTAAIWDGWNIVFIVVAGVAAVGLIVTSIQVSRSNEALTEVSEELNHAKDLKAEGEIASTTRLANDAGERAGNLEIEAEKQRERAAKAERDLLELKKSLAPRRLSAEQKNKLVAIFRSFGPIGIHWADTGGGEAADLASDFVGAADAANITIKGYNVSLGEYFRGFSLRVGVNRESEAAKILAFLAENFPHSPVSSVASTGDPNNLAIVVGIKP